MHQNPAAQSAVTDVCPGKRQYFPEMRVSGLYPKSFLEEQPARATREHGTKCLKKSYFHDTVPLILSKQTKSILLFV